MPSNFIANKLSFVNRKIALIVLLLVNALVLLGQIWPEGAPPFARSVNIAAGCANLIFIVACLRRKR